MSETSVTSLLQAADGSFVPVGEWDGEFEDPDHIDGAIVLSVDGEVFFDESLWDLVDQLWAYILNMLEELGEKDSVKTFFPDQPVELVFRRIGGGRLVISVDTGWRTKRTLQVDEADFARALLGGAEEFFTGMERLLPGRYGYQLDQLGRLKNRW